MGFIKAYITSLYFSPVDLLTILPCPLSPVSLVLCLPSVKYEIHLGTLEQISPLVQKSLAYVVPRTFFFFCRPVYPRLLNYPFRNV